jgi:hypothetical protein
VTEHGNLLISHLVLQSIGLEETEYWVQSAQESQDWAWEWTEDIVRALASAVKSLYGKNIFLTSVFTDAHKCRELAEAVTAELATLNHARTDSRAAHVKRRPNSVSVLVDHNRIPDGTRLIYRPSSPIEDQAIGDWLREDPRRYLATWVNDRQRPLIWEADQQAYSPSGLVMHIWRQARWSEAPVAVRGPASWYLPGESTLADLAGQLTHRATLDGGA